MEVTFGPSEKKQDTKRLTSIEMKCFRTEGYTLCDNKNNEDVLQELKGEPVDENLRKYNPNWLHLTRMNTKRTPKLIPSYRPNERRQLGRLLKKLRQSRNWSMKN